MLRSTFIHLDGIGVATEKKLWQKGIKSWDDLLERGLEYLPKARKPAVHSGVCESIRNYDANNWNFFERNLPPSQKWRAYQDLKDRVLFLDIETTGLADADSITLIGGYNGSESKVFVAGLNLEDAAAEINRYPLLVTFSGTCFDLPVIRRHFGAITENHIHIDLRYSLRWLGYRGGLKVIEKQLGIERSPETHSLDGWDAVRLWHEYRHGSREALELLKKYNGEDVRHLENLLEIVCHLGGRRIDLPFS
jgi:uncharacterized protein YprB with RNaseH-like and TPR domain